MEFEIFKCIKNEIQFSSDKWTTEIEFEVYFCMFDSPLASKSKVFNWIFIDCWMFEFWIFNV